MGPAPGSPGVLKTYAPELGIVQRLADATIIFVGYRISCFIYEVAYDRNELLASTLAIAAFFIAAELNGLYRSWRGSSIRQELLQTFLTWTIAVAALLFFGFAAKVSTDYSRLASTSWFAGTPVLLGTFRIAVRQLLKTLRARGFNTRTVAIAGSTTSGERLAKAIASDASLGLRIMGVYDDRNRRRQIREEQAPYKGTLEKLLEDARTGSIDIIYITLPLRAEHRISSLVHKLADTTVTVYIVPEFFAYDLLHARWGTVGDMQVVSIFDSPFNGLGGWIKRLEDLVLGTLIMTVIALPMLVIALVIKLDSRGPVFFRQRRYGLAGKPIFVWKFRSMTVCEDGDKISQARKGDQRITKVGAFLRRTSLDEFPQFFNVLAGDMSIVGPRPHAVAHNELYRGKIHGYMLRHKVKPGITGWAQVNGWRGETDTVEKMEKRIEHDLYYIHNWRFEWDLQIIWLTVFGRKVRDNAY